MRIWFVNNYALPPGSKGGPTRHLGIARALRDRGHEVTIIASIFDHYSRTDHRARVGTWWQVEDIEGVRYVWLHTPRYGDLKRRAVSMAVFAARVAQLKRRMSGESPDVVIGSSPHLLAPLGARFLARSQHVPFIMEVRDIWPQSLIDLGEMSAGHPAMRALSLLEGHLYRRADAVVTVLPFAREHLLERGADASCLYVVPNGVELQTERSERVPHSGFVATYAGTMGLANGLEVAVDAGIELHKRGREDIVIRLVGDGPERNALLTRASGCPNVRIESAIRAAEVPQLLAESDVGLLLLRDSPVFRWGISPTKLFDYMAAELPVVSAVSAPSDSALEVATVAKARPGDPGSLADALEFAAGLTDDARGLVGRAAREHVLRFNTFDALSEQVERTVEAVLAGSSRDASLVRPQGMSGRADEPS